MGMRPTSCLNDSERTPSAVTATTLSTFSPGRRLGVKTWLTSNPTLASSETVVTFCTHPR